MPFLGTTPTQGFVGANPKQSFTANGSTTVFTLTNPVASANDLEVFVGNVRQEPTAAYTAAGTTLTMSEAPDTGLNFYVINKSQAQVTTTPPVNSISTDKIVNNAVTAAKIPNSAITDAKIAAMAATKLTGAVSIARFPTGSIVQVQENTRTSSFSVSASGSYTDMGLGVVISPQSTSSKILVTISLNGYYERLGGVTGYIHTRIARVIGGSVSACTGTATNMDTEIGRNGSQGDHRNIVMTILDEPNTISAITYRAEYITASGSSGVMYNDTSATSTAIAMEILG